MKITLLLLFCALNFAICEGVAPGANNQSANISAGNAANTGAANQTANTSANQNASATTVAVKPTPDKSECLKAKMEGGRLIASQTFVFDFEPFKESCFVTFGSKEDMLDEKDVPRGSTFHIFKDGKKVYDFEDAFDGLPACWVEAVAFEDLNGDSKTDVIIAGSCLAAKDSYPANAVYMNKGDEFQTIASANRKLDEFKTIKQILNYVKSHNKEF